MFIVDCLEFHVTFMVDESKILHPIHTSNRGTVVYSSQTIEEEMDWDVWHLPNFSDFSHFINEASLLSPCLVRIVIPKKSLIVSFNVTEESCCGEWRKMGGLLVNRFFFFSAVKRDQGSSPRLAKRKSQRRRSLWPAQTGFWGWKTPSEEDAVQTVEKPCTMPISRNLSHENFQFNRKYRRSFWSPLWVGNVNMASSHLSEDHTCHNDLFFFRASIILALSLLSFHSCSVFAVPPLQTDVSGAVASRDPMIGFDGDAREMQTGNL